jgi:hypothetical protein
MYMTPGDHTVSSDPRGDGNTLRISPSGGPHREVGFAFEYLDEFEAIFETAWGNVGSKKCKYFRDTDPLKGLSFEF